MCTVITKAQREHPKTAKKNITVYKVGKLNPRDNFFHPHFRLEFYYIKNECNKTRFTFGDPNYGACPCDTIEQYYRDEIRAQGKNPQYVERGFHAFCSLKRARSTSYSNSVIGEFLIPAGSEYYLNPAECIVSNQIVFIEIVK